MNSGKTIFAQLMDFIPSVYDFRCCVGRYHGNYKVKSFSFLLGSVSNSRLCAAHLSRESQRHRSVPASSAAKTLSYGPSKSGVSHTLANANQVRDWRIYADFAHTLIQEARNLYKGEPLCVRRGL
jgi:hypothetical protein